MNPRALLGIYIPGRTPWHRAGVGLKYLCFLALLVPALLSTDWRLSLVMLGLALAVVASTRAPLRLAWGLPPTVLVIFAGLFTYQAVQGRPEQGVCVVSALAVAMLGSRLLLLTTPMPELMDALVRAVRPLRRFGVDPERFGLAVAVMLRSIPFVGGAYADVRRALQARGLDSNPVTAITPVVIATVAFARTTGDALAARGLGEGQAEV